MDIKLNEILKLTTEEIENSRIELNMTEGAGGIAYIDKWLTLEQSIKDSVYRNVHIGVGMVIKKTLMLGRRYSVF